MIKIPVYMPSLTGNEKKYVDDCLESTWISSKGEYINKFEKAFSNYIGVKYSTAVSNGTVALHLALETLGIGTGDEVIVPTLTYIASVNSIAYTGASPVFVDSLAETWQIDPADVESKITDKTKAIIVVHLYGHPCDMDKIMEIAKRRGLFVIEDCAESFGSLYNGKHTGTFGDVSIFSFFGNKTITTGEGGMVSTNNETIYDRAVHFKGQGLAKYREYWHDVIGYNYRMTNICAAIGLAQLEQADKFIAQKREIMELYKKHLNGLPLSFQPELKNVRHSYWMVSIILDDPSARDDLRKYLLDDGIETRPLFYPAHTMPMYSGKYQSHPVAEDIGWRGMNLPSYPQLTEKEIKEIAKSFKSFFAK